MNGDIYFHYEWQYKKEDLKYCPRCAHSFSLEDLHIKNQPQLICHNCKFIFYLDPKLAVVALVLNPARNKVLLLKRGEEPGKGLRSFPGGHVERGVGLHEAIQNELKEEADIEIEVGEILKTYSFPEGGLIQIVFEALALSEDITINIESLDGRFFEFNDIPWDDLAFQTTKDLLKEYLL
jgi:ADP-ribose pyrophosphatase YjhB (NUDIX family)